MKQVAADHAHGSRGHHDAHVRRRGPAPDVGIKMDPLGAELQDQAKL